MAVNLRPARALAVLVAIVTASGQATLAQQGGSLEFDGTDDHVTVPFHSSFPDDVFSISAWIKTLPAGHRAAIIARGEDDNSWDLAWHLYLEPDGSMRLMVETSSMANHCYPYVCFSDNLQSTCTLSGSLDVADDTWHHVAATRSASGDLVMYVDGQVVAECVQTAVPSADNFQDLTIGCTHGIQGPPPGGIEPPTWFFPGRIDEPAMWNIVLSASRVQDVYGVGVDPKSAGLVGFWTFEDAPGQAVTDLSPAGNNGFLGEESSVDNADPIWIAGAVACDADIDDDGDVGIIDFLALLAAWGPCVGCAEDLDDDGNVGINDFLALLAAWGPCG